MAEFGDHPLYRCRNCLNPLALRHDLISKKFLARTGQAYMFAHAMNVVLGRKEERQLMTGVYTVANIYCSNCGEELGWKYLRAHDARQKWKEGNFIIEKLKMIKEYE